MIGAEEAVWPQFRGPGGLGIAPDNQTYPARLDTSKNLLWKTEVPPGHSSPCVWADRIFITARSDEVLETICMDRASGTIKWRQAVRPETLERVMSANSHASPTPACDGKRVYVYFGSFGLAAYDLDGNEVWKRPLAIPEIAYGSGASPMLANDMVIINCDPKPEKDAYLLAVDRKTGETVWRCNRPGTEPGWSTPVLWKHGNQEELVVVGSGCVTSYNLKDGKELWRLPGLPKRTCASPVYTDDTLFATAAGGISGDSANPAEVPDFAKILDKYDADGDKQLAQTEIPDDLVLVYRLGPLFAVKRIFRGCDADGDGGINAEEWKRAGQLVIKQFGKGRKMDTLIAIRASGAGEGTELPIKWRTDEGIGQVASPLLYRGRIYLLKHRGIVTCLDAATGNKMYAERLGTSGYYCASPVAGDGKIYVCSSSGMVFIVQAADRLEVLSRNKLGERINATPALVDGNIYLRTAKHVMAFGI
jgi:outer membrane protein assembly factor BamB